MILENNLSYDVLKSPSFKLRGVGQRGGGMGAEREANRMIPCCVFSSWTQRICI